MNRREVLKGSAAFGLVAAVAREALGDPSASPGAAVRNPLPAPAQGSIPVAFLVSDGAVVIDFCGPWEVFQDTVVPGRADDAFRLYTVAETTAPIQASGGLKIVPDYTFQTAPQPKVIVIPAQSARSEATLEWIRKASKGADLTLSVCTGAFLLAATGLLSGKAATTHHASYKTLAFQYSDVHVKRGLRYVEDGAVASAGGLSSGIDLALRVVERYFGREVAAGTAYQMEYLGDGWKKPGANAVYAAMRVSTDAHPICPVCEMDVDKGAAPTSVYRGRTYYFCMPAHKEAFDASPGKWL